MTIININITNINAGNTFFVKADGADYIQCPVAEAEGIAVLRYIPITADSIEGEVYANGTALKRMLPTTVTFTAIGITAIDVFAKKHSDSTWLQVGKSLDASGGSAQFRLLPSDFVVGDIIDIKLKDVDTDISAIAESLEILPSFTLAVYPTGAKALELAQTFSGTAQTDRELTITLSSTTGSKVVTTTPVLGEWSEDIALTTDDGFDSGDGVNVEISRTSYDAKDYGVLYSVVGTLVIETGYAPFITGNIELDSAFNVSVASNIEGKNIIIEAQLSGGDWSSVTQIGTAMVTEGIALASCTVPATDFDANDAIQVRARYGTLASVAESLSIIATLTIDAPTLTAGVEGAVSGTSNHVGQKIEVELRLADQDPEDSWTPFGQATVDGSGDWSVTSTVPAAGTYDFRVIDENIDPDVCFAQLDDVVVASGESLPTTNLYDTYDLSLSVTNTTDYIGSMYESLAHEDIILIHHRDSGLSTGKIKEINTDSKTLGNAYTPTGYYTDSFGSDSQVGAVAFLTNRMVIIRNGYREYTNVYNYTANASRIIQSTSPRNMVGLFLKDSTVHFLGNDSKIYSCAYQGDAGGFPSVKFSGVLYDLSAVLTANNAIKYCAYDSTQNYLHVLVGTNLKTIDLDTSTVVGEITLADSNIKSITFHKSRIIYGYCASTSVFRMKILKNSNDA